MFSENLSNFFNANELADNATIGAATVAGILDNQFVDILGIEAMRPVFTTDESEVSTITHGDSLIIKGLSYKVAGIQPDGTGLTSFILEKQ